MKAKELRQKMFELARIWQVSGESHREFAMNAVIKTFTFRYWINQHRCQDSTITACPRLAPLPSTSINNYSTNVKVLRLAAITPPSTFKPGRFCFLLPWPVVFNIRIILIKNAIKFMAFMCRNYLFAGEHKGTIRFIMLYSLPAASKLKKVEPLQWFKQTINTIPNYRANHLEFLWPLEFVNLGKICTKLKSFVFTKIIIFIVCMECNSFIFLREVLQVSYRGENKNTNNQNRYQLSFILHKIKLSNL